MQAEYHIESFPTWTTPTPPQRKRISWVSIGSYHEIALLVQLWSRVMQHRIWDLPEDDSITWHVTDAVLSGARRDSTVRIHDGIVQIDRRHLREFRDQADWLLEHIADEHGDHRYVWCRDVGDYVRVSEERPITDLDDARRVIPVIESIREIAADNVVKFMKRV